MKDQIFFLSFLTKFPNEKYYRENIEENDA
jgi:hypothetical protein